MHLQKIIAIKKKSNNSKKKFFFSNHAIMLIITLNSKLVEHCKVLLKEDLC